MKSILSKIGIFAILMYGGSSCSVEQDDKGTEPVEKETFEIATIDKLNQNADEINSHKDSFRRSSLEKNTRSYIELNEEDLHVAHPCYARIKRMQNGNYIMFYEENEHGGNIHYAISSNLKIWEYRGALLEKTDMIDPDNGSAYVRHYSCPEAVVLKNGDILVVAQYRPGLNYRVRGHINGLVTLRSSDNGRTWSKPEDIYQGVNWEPYLLELSNGDIHCYFTDSRRTEIVAKDTGTAMMLSKDGGKTWEPGYGSDPYLVIRSKYEGYVRDEYVHIYGEKKTAYNDQMPVVIQLNDSKELAAVMETARPKSDYDITFAYSGEDGEWDYLAEDQTGPEDRNEKAFHGAGPYIVQFPSGETVMSHGQAYDGSFSIRMGNEKARNFGKEMKVFSGAGYWGSLLVADAHRLIAIMPNVDGGYVRLVQYVLNHDITAESCAITLDGNNADWMKGDALFVGSDFEAQASFRCSFDAANIYCMLDVLDREIAETDYAEIYFSPSSSSKLVENESMRIKLSKNGILSTELYGSDGKWNGSDNGITVKTKTHITASDKGGYTAEIAIPKSALNVESDIVCVNVALIKSGINDYIVNMDTDKTEAWPRIYGLSGGTE